LRKHAAHRGTNARRDIYMPELDSVFPALSRARDIINAHRRTSTRPNVGCCFDTTDDWESSRNTRQGLHIQTMAGVAVLSTVTNAPIAGASSLPPPDRRTPFEDEDAACRQKVGALPERKGPTPGKGPRFFDPKRPKESERKQGKAERATTDKQRAKKSKGKRRLHKTARKDEARKRFLNWTSSPIAQNAQTRAAGPSGLRGLEKKTWETGLLANVHD